jgi:hypothetical protein
VPIRNVPFSTPKQLKPSGLIPKHKQPFFLTPFLNLTFYPTIKKTQQSKIKIEPTSCTANFYVLSSFRLIGRLRTTTPLSLLSLYGSVSATKPGLVPLSPRGILLRIEEQSRPHRRENRRFVEFHTSWKVWIPVAVYGIGPTPDKIRHRTLMWP